MDQQDFIDLLRRYSEGNVTEAERVQVESWYNEQKAFFNAPDLKEGEQDIDAIEAYIMAATRPRILHLWRWASVAAVLAGVFVVIYFVNRKPGATENYTVNNEALLPLNKGVTLTLGNGQQVSLNRGYSGTINNTSITQQDSVLDYSATNNTTTETNTVNNNGDRPFYLQLADGSEVTLDIQSSLTYPVAFNGKQRSVQLHGQGYFKVKHNAKQPFQVKAGDQVIEDIGTQFNIDAYGNVKSTLVEGAAKVFIPAHINEAIILKPGEQAIEEKDRLIITKADIEEVTAWMQDKIIFRKAKLSTIMTEIARVYGVTVNWQDELQQREFMCVFNRKKPLATVLNNLRQGSTDIDFKLNDKVVTIFIKKNNKPN